MGKRGQVTFFIIAGIVLVVLIMLYIIAVRQQIIPPFLTPSTAASELSDIETHIGQCMDELGTAYVTKIGLQGGYLAIAPDTSRLFNDTQVSYLCWYQDGKPTCTNRMLTLSHMEGELKSAMEEALQTCVNVYDYSDDVTASGEMSLDVEINRATVDFTLTYPLTIVKGDDTVSLDMFSSTVKAPLGELYDVSQDAVNDHATIGDFDQLFYMLSKMGKYTIYKYKPYPDVIYQLKFREGTYIFQFAIQGQEKV